jgi:hypothetical protein
LKRLLDKGADVDGTDVEGCTPLHYAALGGSAQTVEYLMAQGTDINAVSTWYGSPLCLAAIHGHVKVVEAMLAEGALVNMSCMFLGSAAHAACVGGDMATLRVLNARGADFSVYRTTCIELWRDFIEIKGTSLTELRKRPMDEYMQVHHGSPGALAVELGLHHVVDYCLNDIASLSVHEPLSCSREWTKEALLCAQSAPRSHWGKSTLIMSVSSRSDDRTMRLLLPHDPAFEAQPNSSEYFTMGKVFSTLRPKSGPSVVLNVASPLPRSASSESITSEVRRFVVIYGRDDGVSCSCVPVIAHDEAPLLEMEHAVVYTDPKNAAPTQEVSLAWNYQTMLKPIRVDSNAPHDILLPMSRLNFGDIIIVGHTLKVKPFESVNLSSMSDLGNHFSDVWARIIKRIPDLRAAQSTGMATEPPSKSTALLGCDSQHMPAETQVSLHDDGLILAKPSPPTYSRQAAPDGVNSGRYSRHISERTYMEGPNIVSPSAHIQRSSASGRLDYVANDPDGVYELRQTEQELARTTRTFEFEKQMRSTQRHRVMKASNNLDSVLVSIDRANPYWCKESGSDARITTTLKKSLHLLCRSLDRHSSLLPDPRCDTIFYEAVGSILTVSIVHTANQKSLLT